MVVRDGTWLHEHSEMGNIDKFIRNDVVRTRLPLALRDAEVNGTMTVPVSGLCLGMCFIS